MRRIREFQKRNGIKQFELGKMLNVQDATISKYKTWKILLTADTKIQLSEIFLISDNQPLGTSDSNSDGIASIFVIAMMKKIFHARNVIKAPS